MNISKVPLSLPILEPLPNEIFALLTTFLPQAVAYLLVPTSILYSAIYIFLKHNRCTILYQSLIFLSVTAFLAAPYVTPLHCAAFESLQRFAIASGVLKALDLYVRSTNFFPTLPIYTYAPNLTPVPRWHLALLLLTELRYESFKNNPIHPAYSPSSIATTKPPRTTSDPPPISNSTDEVSPPLQEPSTSESTLLILHILLFITLHSVPVSFLRTHLGIIGSAAASVILAFEVQISIYLLWTALQLIVRYKDSPPLFGALWRARSLGSFWSETWHNAYTSPCTSLAYTPIRTLLPLPAPFARAAGLLGAFALMAAFHMYALAPIIPLPPTSSSPSPSPSTIQSLLSTLSLGIPAASWRIGLFFVLNGLGVIVEGGIWGKEKGTQGQRGRGGWKGVVKMVLAWCFEMTVAGWAARGVEDALAELEATVRQEGLMRGIFAGCGGF